MATARWSRPPSADTNRSSDFDDVQAFIGTDAYRTHKDRRFPKLDNRDISSNPAFSLSDPDTFGLYERAYERTAALYYHGRSTLKELLARIASNAERLSRSGRIPAALYKRLFHSWSRMDPAATGPGTGEEVDFVPTELKIRQSVKAIRGTSTYGG